MGPFGNGFINPNYAVPAMQQQLAGMMRPQPMPNIYGQQAAGYGQPAILKGRMVTNYDEVKAAQIDMDGSNTFFPCPAENCIYVKSIDLDGNAIIQRYGPENKVEKPVYASVDDVSDIDKRLKQLETILLAKGGEQYVQSTADAAAYGTIAADSKSYGNDAIIAGKQSNVPAGRRDVSRQK